MSTNLINKTFEGKPMRVMHRTFDAKFDDLTGPTATHAEHVLEVEAGTTATAGTYGVMEDDTVTVIRMKAISPECGISWAADEDGTLEIVARGDRACHDMIESLNNAIRYITGNLRPSDPKKVRKAIEDQRTKEAASRAVRVIGGMY